MATSPGETPPPAAPPRTSLVTNTFFAAMFMASLVALTWLLWGFLADFILAFMFTGMLRPAFDRWCGGRASRRAPAALVLAALLALVLAVPLGLLVAGVAREVGSLYEHTVGRLTEAEVNAALFGDGWLPRNARAAAQAMGVDWTPETVRALLVRVSGAVIQFITGHVERVLGGVVGAVFHFFIMAALVFYLLLDGPRLLRFLHDTSPLPEAEEDLLVKTFRDAAQAALIGNGIGSVSQGILAGLSMWAVGITAPVLWGTVMSVLAFLPIVGISLVTIPVTLFLVLTGQPGTALAFIAFNLVQSVFLENVVKSWLVGDRMQVHTMLVFLAILGGISAFGALGILYGPLLAALFLALARLYDRDYRQRAEGTA